MKRLFLFLLVPLTIVSLFACNKANAIYLEDGEVLFVLNNTLGEGAENNLTERWTYKNESKIEATGNIYKDDHADKYYMAIYQGTRPEFIEITNVKDGDVLSSKNFIESNAGNNTEWVKILNSGVTILDKKHDSIYGKSTTNDRYCYEFTDSHVINIWHDRLILVSVVNNTLEGPQAISFKIDMPDYMKYFWILQHTGDYYSINGEIKYQVPAE